MSAYLPLLAIAIAAAVLVYFSRKGAKSDAASASSPSTSSTPGKPIVEPTTGPDGTPR